MSEKRPWESSLSESYWQALLDQGEIPPPATGSLVEPPLGEYQESSDSAAGAMGAAASRLGNGSDEAWSRLSRWFAAGKVFTAPVIGCNKGGLLVRVCQGIGFVPASQLAELPTTLGTADLRRDLESMVGEELTLRLIELDRSRNRLICSERATQWEDDQIEGRLDELEKMEGRRVDGTVRSVCDFGAFVDLGGLDGLVHISEMSWQRVRHPGDVLSVGDAVEVIVLKVDRANRRVALSSKRLTPDPWAQVGEHYRVGDVIDVTITNVVPFGAFARVSEGVEGLIHISELSDGPFVDIRHVVAEGEEVQARVLHIDPQSRRLGLSLRHVLDD